MKYDDTDFSPRKCFEDWELTSDVTGRGLLDMAIVFVEELICFYRWMAQQPLGELPGSLFQSLLKIEERHVIELKKIRSMDYF